MLSYWLYQQVTGNLYWVSQNGSHLLHSVGYAGKGKGKNNPEWEMVHDFGPAPRGLYDIGEVVLEHPRVGAFALPLIPRPTNEMFGRAGFFMHGDNPAHIGDSSDGCLVFMLDTRKLVDISKGLERLIEVY